MEERFSLDEALEQDELQEQGPGNPEYTPPTGEKKEEKRREEYRAVFDGLIDVVEGDKGVPCYLIRVGDSLHLTRGHEEEGKEYVPPPKEHLPFELPRAEEVKRWFLEDDDGKLFEDVVAYLGRFSYLEEGYRRLLAAYVLLTYLQDSDDLYYLPEIVFFGPPENGKSRTGKAMTSIAYRGIHLVDLREPNIFRYSQNLQATLFFDAKSLWKKAEKQGSEDLLLLRFERGAKASRILYPDRGPFRDTIYYDVFGPTLIATNDPIHSILDTRSINIPLPNKPGRYENLLPRKGLVLKERLTAWRARMQGVSLPQVDPIPGVEGRLYDIAEPLLQVAQKVHPETVPVLVEVIREIAGKRLEAKKDSIEGLIVAWLKDHEPEGMLPMWEHELQELVTALNEGRPERFHIDSRRVGRKLTSLGVMTRRANGVRYLIVRREVFDDLVRAYLPGGVNGTNGTNGTIPRPSSLHEEYRFDTELRNGTETVLPQTRASSSKVPLVPNVPLFPEEQAQGEEDVFVPEEEGVVDISDMGVEKVW